MEKKDIQILARFLKQNASYRKFRRSENYIKYDPYVIKNLPPSYNKYNFIYTFFQSSKCVFESSFWDLLDKKWCKICDEVFEKHESFLGLRINKYDACSELDYEKYYKLYNGT